MYPMLIKNRAESRSGIFKSLPSFSWLVAAIYVVVLGSYAFIWRSIKYAIVAATTILVICAMGFAPNRIRQVSNRKRPRVVD